MKKRNIVLICQNLTIKDYFYNNLEEKFQQNLITLLNTDEDIVNKIEESKPSLFIIYYGIKTADDENIIKVIYEKTVYSEIPILFVSFSDFKDDLEEIPVRHGILKIPSTKEQLNMEVDKLLNEVKYVMILDDSKLIHSQLREIFRKNNLRYIEAYNGKEALELLKIQKPDIITSDVEMPVMNGYEFCRNLKSNPVTENIPIVMLSSLSSGIDVDRGFDAGANDYLTKPVDEEELISRINTILNEEGKSTREKVLAVDDSKMIRNMLVQGFKQQGFKTFFAVNGADGLKKAKEILPDIITTDYDMPVMNGWELCQELRKDEVLRDIPVIMLTSRDAKRDRAKQSAAGVKAYLTKPFTVDKLLAVVERVLAEKKMQREREILKLYVSDAALSEARQRSKAGDGANNMRAKEVFATVLFTDIVSFTPTCEKLSPNELITLLNEYYDVMCTVIKNNKGIIDKFIGDAILAIFGNVENGAYQAVKAGWEMIQSLKEFNEGRETPVHMRIGINSGKLYMGDIGSKLYRRDFTVIGDNVNIGQRLESSSQHDGILISQSTYDIVKDMVEVESVGPLSLKGKKKQINAYQVKSIKIDNN